MRKGIIVVGVVLVIAALTVGVTGIVLAQGPVGGMIGGMMGRGMMGGGMMNGGMMGGMMGQGANPDMSQCPMSGGMMGNEGVTGDMSLPFDQRFLDQMVAHHQMGVTMTQHMAVGSSRPQLQDLAQRIISAQLSEITQMQQWRRDWYGAPSTSTAPGGIMSGMMGGMMNRKMMRGMMGENFDFDRAFLQMMIPHHEGAIKMAEQALAESQHPEMQNLARKIIAVQRAEIEEMQGYLKDWYGIQ